MNDSSELTRGWVEHLLDARVRLSRYLEREAEGEEVPPLLKLCAERCIANAKEALQQRAQDAGGVLRVPMGGWAFEVRA